jgi:hypothetical protein
VLSFLMKENLRDWVSLLAKLNNNIYNNI